MPSFTLIPSEAGSPINFTAAVPVDDMNMAGFTATWLPDRPMSADDIRIIESWTGAYAEVEPNTFEPIANQANDYLLDREKQRNENFTGMRGIREEDIAIQENLVRADRGSDQGALGYERRRSYRVATPIVESGARSAGRARAAGAPTRRRVSRPSNRQSHAL